MPGPFELYLIRHGVAEDRGEAWPDDAKRPLTAKGKARLTKAMRGLAAAGVQLDLVLTSPLVRARQTADVIAGVFEPHPHIVAIDSLAPGGSYQAVLADLERHSRKSKIALVGHEPDLGELAARLAGSRRRWEFKKGGMCRIDVQSLPLGGPGSLRWFLTPRLMRGLKR